MKIFSSKLLIYFGEIYVMQETFTWTAVDEILKYLLDGFQRPYFFVLSPPPFCSSFFFAFAANAAASLKRNEDYHSFVVYNLQEDVQGQHVSIMLTSKSTFKRHECLWRLSEDISSRILLELTFHAFVEVSIRRHFSYCYPAASSCF